MNKSEMKKNLKSSIFGVLILLIGIVIGVFLVGQSQYFRNSAKEEVEPMFTVCHKSGSIWEELSVNDESLKKYLDNGDIFGNCPSNLKRK
jgi:hypothetical protein